MKQKRVRSARRLMRAALAAGVALVGWSVVEWGAASAFSQEPQGLQISHYPPPPQAIPYPGQELPLQVTVTGTRDFSQRLRTLLVKDGKLVDSSIYGGTLDERDNPTYTVTVPAPVVGMSYQFILYGESGPVASQRFVVKRPCLPSTAVVRPEVKEGEGLPEVLRLARVAKGLEREIIAYENATKLLEEIERMVTHGPKNSEKKQ